VIGVSQIAGRLPAPCGTVSVFALIAGAVAAAA
jgi:hypothetical protein